MKYIYFKSKNLIKNKIPQILEIISEAITILKFESDDDSLTIYYNFSSVSINELTNIIVSELFEDILVYESLNYDNNKELEESLLIVKNYIEFKYIKNNYINNQTILKSFQSYDENIKKLILNKYYNDKEMILTIITFLEHNQNVSKASEYLYIHRNTLNQRLNKFIETTNFNPKKFIDGHLLYKLLK